MSDNPPPRKKSRFFSNGKSKIGNILHPFRKPSQKGDEDSIEEHTDDDDDNSSNAEAISSPSSQIPPLPHQSAPRPQAGLVTTSFGIEGPPHLAPPQHFSTSSSHASNATNGRRQSQSPLAPALQQATGSEAETDLERSDDEHQQNPQWDERDEENARPKQNPKPTLARPALDEKAVRKQRREGIYGVEALLPDGDDEVAQGSNSTAYLGSISTGYAFGATNSGNTQFNFRATQRLAPVQPIPHAPHHTITSGLSHIAQEAMYMHQPDTGPLGGGAQQQLHTLPGHPFQTPLPTVGGTATYVDVDRDERGCRIANPPAWTPLRAPRPPAHHGIFVSSNTLPLGASLRAPRHLANPESLVPENEYMSPYRIAHARHHARISLKRKRPENILPPPSYTYQRTNDPNFNIFHGILLYPELVFALAAALPSKDLLSLYAISRDFHTIVDTRFTTMILSQATSKARESALTFPFRSFAHLCRTDPAARIPHPNTTLAAKSVPRKIPSFRWLAMVLHREKVIHELMTVFAEDGIPLPHRCSLALKRLWFLLDIPDNARRIGYTHNQKLMTDLDLYFAGCFVTKLDMRLNDPVSGEKRDGMRKLLLSQRSFTTILRVLKRDIWTTRLQVLREWVKCKYEPEEDEEDLDIFGVPAHLVGMGRFEYWGIRTEKQLGREPEVLHRPDQLIVREAFRRGMRFDEHYLRFMLFGYVRPDTLEDYAPRTYGRRIEEIRNDEYEVDDLVGGVSALDVGEEGFDDLLDLGQPRKVSRYTIVKEEMSKGEKELRRKEEAFLKMCVQWWERETETETGREMGGSE